MVAEKPQSDGYTLFAGLTSDTLPTAAIEEVKYEGWLIVEEATTPIDWTCHTSLPMDHVFTIEPLNQAHGMNTNLTTHICMKSVVECLSLSKRGIT